MKTEVCNPTRFPGVLFLVLAAALQTLTAMAQAPGKHKMHVDVRLVVIPVGVSSSSGDPVTNLVQDSFVVLEEGKPRPIRVFEKSENLPLQMILLIDTSLSAAKELSAEKEAMARFIRRVLRRQDAAALVEMAGDARTVVDFSSEPGELEESLKPIKARAGTALYDTLVEASEMLGKREGRRVLVLITDGNDTTSKSDYRTALDAVTRIDATLFALVVRPIPGESGRSVRGEHVLISLAELTGGQVFFPAGVVEMDKFFDELGSVLRTQYLLGIIPADSGPDYRQLEVRVKGGGYSVRHRKGYFVDSNQ